MASEKTNKFLSEPLLWVAMSMVGVVLMGPSAANLARGLVGGDPNRGDVDEHGEPLYEKETGSASGLASNGPAASAPNQDGRVAGQSSVGDRLLLAENTTPRPRTAANLDSQRISKPTTGQSSARTSSQTKRSNSSPVVVKRGDSTASQTDPHSPQDAQSRNSHRAASDAVDTLDHDGNDRSAAEAEENMSKLIHKKLAAARAENARSQAAASTGRSAATGAASKPSKDANESAFDVDSMIDEVVQEFERDGQENQDDRGASRQVAAGGGRESDGTDPTDRSIPSNPSNPSDPTDPTDSADRPDSSETKAPPTAPKPTPPNPSVDIATTPSTADRDADRDAAMPDTNEADEAWKNPLEFESGLSMDNAALAIAPSQPTTANSLIVPLESGDHWWEATVGQQFWPERHAQLASLDSVVFVALQNSAQVQILNDQPQIQSTFVQEREADFDWSTFVDASWSQTNEPVRNELQTGSRTGRFEEDELFLGAGLKKRLAQGGQLAIGSTMGTLDNNSIFLSPPDQGSSTFSLDYRQPLLRGRGREIAQSQIVLARLNSEVTAHASKQQLQQYLADVVTAYWSLYRARGILSQRHRNATRASAIAEQLANHEDAHTLARQINRARAIASTRQSDVIDAEYAVADAQERLMNLTHGDSLADANMLEIVPTDAPPRFTVPHDLSMVTQMAISNRPEVKEVLAEIKAATVQQAIALDSLKPQLDAILSSYVLGVNANKNVGEAIGGRFTDGDPSYSVGMAFEVPIGRRAGNARVHRQEIQRRLLQNRLRKTLGDVTLSARAAFRDVYRLNAIVDNNRQVVQQSVVDLNAMQKHSNLLTSKDQSASLYLNDLLLSQDRLSTAEQSLLDSQAQLAIAYVTLKRATGELLRSDAGGCIEGGEAIEQVTYEQTIEQPFEPTAGQRMSQPMPPAGQPRSDAERLYQEMNGLPAGQTQPDTGPRPGASEPSIPLERGTLPRAVQPVPPTSDTAQDELQFKRPRAIRRASSAALNFR